MNIQLHKRLKAFLSGKQLLAVQKALYFMECFKIAYEK
jgi:hypothetical protein